MLGAADRGATQEQLEAGGRQQVVSLQCLAEGSEACAPTGSPSSHSCVHFSHARHLLARLGRHSHTNSHTHTLSHFLLQLKNHSEI